MERRSRFLVPQAALVFAMILGAGVSRADVPEAAITACQAPPVIDGRLGDDCWRNATVLKDFVVFESAPTATTDRTRVSLTFDNAWLYLGFECAHPHPDRIEQRVFDHDGAVNQEESVEIFLDPGTDGALYFHFLLSAWNVRAEQRMSSKAGRDRAWNIPWRSATQKTDKGWTAEVAIPIFLLVSYGDLDKARLNICRTALLPKVDAQGMKQGDVREMSSWAPILKTFHEPEHFGRLKGLAVTKAETPFLPGMEKPRAGGYSLAEGRYGYEVMTEVSAHTPKSGRAKIVVTDRPAGGKETSVSQTVEVEGMKRQRLSIRVPVETLSARSVQVVMQDADTGEVLESMPVEDTSVFNLMSAFLNQSYYTTETHATAVCDFGLPAEELRKTIARAKTADGKVLAEEKGVTPRTCLRFPIADLPTGTHPITVELARNSGEGIFSLQAELVKMPPKPGSEVKTDRLNGVVLRDGKPLFPFGMLMYGMKAGDEEDFRKVADAGFNTAFLWSYMSPEDAKPYLEAAKRQNLLVISATEHFSKQRLCNLKGQIVTDPAIRKLPQPERSKMFADAFEKGLDELLQAVRNVKDYPNLLAHYSFDEPFTPDFFDQYVQGQKLYRETNKIDGYHPTYVFYCEKEAVGWTDITGFDPYWIPADVGVKGTPNQVSKVTAFWKKKAEGLHMPLWMVPMAEYYSGCHKRVLLPEEQYCQTYLCIIHGAKGLFYFRYPVYHPMTWAALGKIAKELQVLGPIAVTPDVPQKVTYDPGALDPEKDVFPDVQVSLRQKPEGGYVLLAANSRYYPVDVTYTIAGMGGGEVGRLFATDKCPAAHSAFSDRLEPLGTRAYVLPPGASLAAPVEIVVKMAAHPEQGKPEAQALPREGRPGKKNLVQNPGFEEATLPYWPDYYRFVSDGKCAAATPDADWALDTREPYEGKYCLRMRTNEKRISAARMGYTFYLAPKQDKPTTYTYSVYMKADKEGMKVQFQGINKGPYWWKNDVIPVTPGTWKRYSVTGPLPAGLDQHNTFGLVVYGEGTVWADAVQVEKGEEPTEFER